MIYIRRFTGQRTINAHGIETVVDVSPAEVLAEQGAHIQTTITHPESVQRQLRAEGREVRQANTLALIDTGASLTVITPALAVELRLTRTGSRPIASVHDSQERPTFWGRLVFPWGSTRDLELVACDLAGLPKEIGCLIGRDILRHWHLTYTGIDGSLTICE